MEGELFSYAEEDASSIPLRVTRDVAVPRDGSAIFGDERLLQ
jgi:hypothetical protein